MHAPLAVGTCVFSGLPFLSAGDLPDTGIEPGSPALVGGFFTTELLKFFFQTDEALEFFQIANIY